MKHTFLLLIFMGGFLAAYAQESPYNPSPETYKQDLLEDIRNSKVYPEPQAYEPVDAPMREQPTSDRVTIGCQNLFISGINLAWNEFGMDVGSDPESGDPVHPDMNAFEEMLDSVQNNGGNAIRWWLHVNGVASPAFGDDSLVSGIPSHMTGDMEDVLDAAWERGIRVQICLWSFDMLKADQWQADPDINHKLLTEDAAIQAYIDNALIPMVEALDGHPGLLAWEIFNEPEGMSTITDWGGFAHKVDMAVIQEFVNRCAGAIHRHDDDVIVTNGCWSFIAGSDVGSGNMNYYTDQRLIDAGGDEDGTLDVYNVHYYDWGGTDISPFYYEKAHWQLNKPLVIAEFHANDTPGGTDSLALATNLYNNGYAGAMTWSYTDEQSGDAPPIFPPLKEVYDLAAADIDIDSTACGGAFFTLSENRICENDSVYITNQSDSSAETYSWDFGTDAEPATYDQETPPAISYTSAGTKTISLVITTQDGDTSLTEQSLEVVSSESSHTVTLSADPSLDNCDGNDHVTFSANITPELDASASQATGIPGKSDWEDGASQTSFNINSDGTIPGMDSASQYLLGSWHSWSASSYAFNGTFGSNASLTLSLVNVQTENETPALEILIDGASVYEQNIDTDQHVTVDIPSGSHTITVNNPGNEWLQIDEYTFDNIGLDLTYEWYINGSLADSTTSGSYTTTVSSGDSFYVRLITGEIEECVQPYLLSDTLTSNCTTDITSMTYEQDAFQCYPNPFTGGITVEAKGQLSIYSATGQLLRSEEINGHKQVGTTLPAGTYIFLLRQDGKSQRKLINKQ